jgi:hypothetical protein
MAARIHGSSARLLLGRAETCLAAFEKVGRELALI